MVMMMVMMHMMKMMNLDYDDDGDTFDASSVPYVAPVANGRVSASHTLSSGIITTLLIPYALSSWAGHVSYTRSHGLGSPDGASLLGFFFCGIP